MTRDPHQLFIINAIKLSDIIEYCNDGIKNGGWTHPSGNTTITVDDERLTNELCQEFADAIAGTFESESQQDECECNAVTYLLDKMGFEYHIDPAESASNVLQSQIEQLEREITTKKAMLANL